MIDFLGAAPNLPFTVALAVMLGIVLIEGLSTMMGMGFSSLLDSVMPDIDLDLDVDVDVDVDVDPGLDLDMDAHAGAGHGGGLTGVLAWLRIGQVPLLIVVILFLTAFSLIGLAGQAFVHGATGLMLPAAVAWIPVLFVSLPVVRTTAGWIARLIPKEETSAVSQDSFIGRVGTIVLGTATQGSPTQARLRDEYGKSHYVLVEPDLPDDSFADGDPVLLVKREGSRFRVIRPTSAHLIEALDEQA